MSSIDLIQFVIFLIILKSYSFSFFLFLFFNFILIRAFYRYHILNALLICRIHVILRETTDMLPAHQYVSILVK